MLKSLLIKNFQKHKKFKLNFGRVTTIVGPSDKGKSALIRALVWVMTNKPGGTDFISHGADTAGAKLEFDNSSVSRKKGKAGNTYSLDGEVFKAFGHHTPKEVAEPLNIRDINLQQQHDSPFWFSLSSGEVSKRLNQLVDLTLMDNSVHIAKQRLRKENSRRTVLYDELEDAREKAKEFEWTKQAHRDLKECEVHAGNLENKALDIEDMQSMVEEVDRIIELEDRQTVYIEQAQNLIKGCQFVQRAEEWVGGFQRLVGQLERNEQFIEEVPEFDGHQIAAQLADLEEEGARLGEFLKSDEHLTMKLKAAKDTIIKCQDDLATLKDVAICEACGRPL